MPTAHPHFDLVCCAAIVLQRGDCTLIHDTKWKRLIPEEQDPKRGISQADVYQMMAHAAAYEASAVALIYLHSDGNAEFDLLRIGASDGQIAAVTLPLEELGLVPKRLRNLVSARSGNATPVPALRGQAELL